jgi:CRISPR-associated protein Cas2
MYVAIAYDVVSDRRRRRLHKALHAFTEHVQKSVFEGPLPERREADLRAVIAREIDPGEDTVRIYYLCSRCREMTDIIGTGVFVEAEETDTIL